MKRTISILLAIILIFVMSPCVSAAEAITMPSDFNSFTHVGNITQSDNYYLDVADPGIMDTSGTMIINSMANSVFGAEVLIVQLACTGYYYISTFNLAELLSPIIAPVQKNFKDKLFDGLITLAISCAIIGLAGVMLKRNYPEVFNRITQIIAICAGALLLSTYSVEMINSVTLINDKVCGRIAESLSGQPASTNYNLATVDALWKSLIHEPWKTLEFNTYSYSTELEKELLVDYKKGSKERQKEIDKKHKNDENAFSQDLPGWRLGFLLLYFPIVILKSTLYFLIALVLAFFKLLTIVIFLTGIIVLILAIIPWFGGIQLIGSWGRTILQTQIEVWFISFFMGMLVMIDDALYQQASQWGWFTVLLIQALIIVMMVIFRKKVFQFMKKTHDKINPHLKAVAMQNHARSEAYGHYRNTQDISAINQSATNGYATMAAFNTDGSSYSDFGNADLPERAADEPERKPQLSAMQDEESQAPRKTRSRPVLDIGVDNSHGSEAAGNNKTNESIQRPDLPVDRNATVETHSSSTEHTKISEISTPGVEPQPYNVSREPSIHMSDSMTQSDMPKHERPAAVKEFNFDLNQSGAPSTETRENTPTRRESNEARKNTENEMKSHNERKTAAKDFDFDLGNFEARETTQDNVATVRRPVLEDI